MQNPGENPGSRLSPMRFGRGCNHEQADIKTFHPVTDPDLPSFTALRFSVDQNIAGIDHLFGLSSACGDIFPFDELKEFDIFCAQTDLVLLSHSAAYGCRVLVNPDFPSTQIEWSFGARFGERGDCSLFSHLSVFTSLFLNTAQCFVEHPGSGRPLLNQKMKEDGVSLRDELSVDRIGFSQHQFGGLNRLGVFILVREVNDFAYTALDYNLGAFVAREKGNIDTASLEFSSTGVEYCIQFGMTHVGILGLQKSTFPGPGEVIVGTPPWEAIIPHTDNFVPGAGDTGAHLGRGVLGPQPGKQGYGHKVFIPGQIVLSFTCHLPAVVLPVYRLFVWLASPRLNRWFYQ